MNKNKKKKIILIMLAMVIVLSLFVGVSYAYWRMTLYQSDLNTVLSDCFELNYLENTEAINLQKQWPLTDEEGLKTEGYSFTIQNVCKQTAYYQVNLEDILLSSKRLSNQYIKISLNNQSPKVLNTYSSVTPTIEEADASFQIASGSLKENESVTYDLKLWMDYDTPAIDEAMNATFESKISVVASQEPQEKISQEVTIAYQSKNETYTTDKEMVEITLKSTHLNLEAYSFDNENWLTINPAKTYTFLKEFLKEGTYKLYVKDEEKNVSTLEVQTPMLDQTGPTILAKALNETWQNSNILSVTLADTKSGLLGYNLTETNEEPDKFEEITGETYEFTKEVTENKTYYIWSKDNLENISSSKVTISYIDKEAPQILSLQEQNSYGVTSKIIARVLDPDSGVAGYQFTTIEEEPENYIEAGNALTEVSFSYEAKEQGTIYFYVKDAAGHVAHQSIEVTKIDNEAPTISFDILASSQGENDWYTSLDLKAIVTDSGSGMSHTKYCFTPNESCLPNITGAYVVWGYVPITFIGKNVSQRVCAQATDFAGNTSDTVCSGLYKVDTRTPELKLKASNTETTITLDATSSYDLDSGITSYYFSKDEGKNWILANDNKSYTFTGLSEGESYTLMARVKDEAGRISEEKLSITLPSKSKSLVSILKSITPATSGSGLYEVSHEGETFKNQTDETLINQFRQTELRYAGTVSDTPNYLFYNNELWRIIGLLNTPQGQRIKIVRTIPYSNKEILYNSSSTATWSKSDLKTSLDTNFYYAIGQAFRPTVERLTWNIFRTEINSNYASALKIYQNEKSLPNINENSIESSWVGYVGLIVPSDYGYASIGGKTNNRPACLDNVYYWNLHSNTYGDCIENNWLYTGAKVWTMVTSADIFVNRISDYYGAMGGTRVNLDEFKSGAYPALYLTEDVMISNGKGTKDSPYIVEL